MPHASYKAKLARPADGSKARASSAPSIGRYKPLCPHYPRCVGCPLIDLPYPEQLQRKRDIVREAFAEFPSLAGVEVPAVVPSDRRLGYRGRAKLVVRKNRNDVVLGLYVPGSHRVMDISSCPVHPRPVNQVIRYLKRKLLELGIASYDERNDSGDLRYVDLRYSFGRREVNATLVTRHAALRNGEKLARALQRKFSFVTGVIQNINETRGNVIWGNDYRMLSGRDTILEQIGDLKLGFPPGVFSQANPFMAARLYEHVRALADLNGSETVLDLYCGVGPISLYMARLARQVWAVDDSELSITTAKQNARRNGRGNCRFIAGNVAQTLAQWRPSLPSIDLIVLNPPRKGVQPQAMAELLEIGARRMIYFSCESKSLARDLDELLQHGYRVLQAQPFDMFPQTGEVETVALLTKQ